ncbi:MAG: hypothetical protein IJJ23_02945 [Clostridia bacterium]|nr:hypothetical protein [Clostridia bacterium]
MSNRRHVIVTLICAVMLLSMFVSSAYIAHEATHRHECTGENCPVCQFIAQVEQARRGFGMILLALLLICFALALRRDWRAFASASLTASVTPVSRKIRLNN